MHQAKYTRPNRLIETVMSELVKVVESVGARVRIFEKLAVTDSGVSIRIPLFGKMEPYHPLNMFSNMIQVWQTQKILPTWTPC
jgi:hypothetical protein